MNNIEQPAPTQTPVLDQEDEKHMLPCRFFAHGYCHKGNRCRFYHPNPMSLRSSVRVPGLPVSFLPANANAGGMSPMPRRDRQSRYPFTATARGQAGIMNGGRRQNSHPRRVVNMQQSSNFRQARLPHGFGGGYSEQCIEPAWNEYSQFYNEKYSEDGRVPLFVPPQPMANETENTPNMPFTLFRHIDWSEFLAEGQVPPIPMEVPIPKDRDEVEMISDFRRALEDLDVSKDVPLCDLETENGQGDGPTKLSAKEELQAKMREISLDLAKEPKLPVKSLDSFFKNFTFSSKEKEALLIAPEDISRVARENKLM